MINRPNIIKKMEQMLQVLIANTREDSLIWERNSGDNYTSLWRGYQVRYYFYQDEPANLQLGHTRARAIGGPYDIGFDKKIEVCDRESAKCRELLRELDNVIRQQLDRKSPPRESSSVPGADSAHLADWVTNAALDDILSM